MKGDGLLWSKSKKQQKWWQNETGERGAERRKKWTEMDGSKEEVTWKKFYEMLPRGLSIITIISSSDGAFPRMVSIRGELTFGHCNTSVHVQNRIEHYSDDAENSHKSISWKINLDLQGFSNSHSFLGVALFKSWITQQKRTDEVCSKSSRKQALHMLLKTVEKK